MYCRCSLLLLLRFMLLLLLRLLLLLVLLALLSSVNKRVPLHQRAGVREFEGFCSIRRNPAPRRRAVAAPAFFFNHPCA